MAGILAELVFWIWLRFERVVAWWMRRARNREPAVREVWWARREAAQGSLGTYIRYRPKPRIVRLLELLAWYSPPCQLLVWWVKRCCC